MKLYFVCFIHNKVKVRNIWKKYPIKVKKALRKKRGKIIIVACDECQEMYPYFG